MTEHTHPEIRHSSSWSPSADRCIKERRHVPTQRHTAADCPAAPATDTEQETAAEFLGELHELAGNAPSGYAVYAYVVGLVAADLTDARRAEIVADARAAFPG